MTNEPRTARRVRVYRAAPFRVGTRDLVFLGHCEWSPLTWRLYDVAYGVIGEVHQAMIVGIHTDLERLPKWEAAA